MDILIKDLLREINTNYEKGEISRFNKEIKNKEISSDLFSVPMQIDEETVIGGCPRGLCFEQIGFPVSDLNLYQIEKRKKNIGIIVSSMIKFYEGLREKYAPLGYKIINNFTTERDYKNFDKNSLRLDKQCCGLVDKDNKLILYFHHLVESDKDFRNPSGIAVTEIMPAVISLFKETEGLKEVNVILKHSHSFEEKGITFNISEYLDSYVLVIDGEPTSFDINRYYEIISKTCKEIVDYVSRKEFSPIKNKKHCSKCFYNAFCETIM